MKIKLCNNIFDIDKIVSISKPNVNFNGWSFWAFYKEIYDRMVPPGVIPGIEFKFDSMEDAVNSYDALYKIWVDVNNEDGSLIDIDEKHETNPAIEKIKADYNALQSTVNKLTLENNDLRNRGFWARVFNKF